MARLQCPDCPKIFKAESGLAWHRERSHPAGRPVEGPAVTAVLGQEPQVATSAVPDSGLVTVLTVLQDKADLESKLQVADERLDDALRVAQESWETEKTALTDRVQSLEADAGHMEPLRGRVEELEGQLKRATYIQVAMRQDVTRWQQMFDAEQVAHQKARQRAEDYRQKGLQVWQENQALIDELDLLRLTAKYAGVTTEYMAKGSKGVGP